MRLRRSVRPRLLRRAQRERAESPQDVLISDVGMPHADGMSLIRAVRALPRDRGGLIPALAVTGYARAEDRNAALGAGFQMHCAKPFEPVDLVTAVATLAQAAASQKN